MTEPRDRMVKFHVSDEQHRLIRMAAAGDDQSMAQFALVATLQAAQQRVEELFKNAGGSLGGGAPGKPRRTKG